MRKLNIWQVLALTLTAVSLLPVSAHAQNMMNSPIGQGMSGITPISENSVAPVQRVGIIRSGAYRVQGDNSRGLIDELQPAAFNPNELKRMTITAWPRHLRVVTGISPTNLQPVAYLQKPRGASVIDVLYDAQVNYDTRLGYGQQANGTYVPFPQTPDINVNTSARTVSVDSHLQ